MKRKIIISLVGLMLVSSILLVITSKNTKKTFMQDGVMFAVTVDGESEDSFPSGNNYFVDINCTNARGRWMRVPSTDSGSDDAYRLVIDDITGTVKCDVDFTSNPKTLINTITGLIQEGETEYSYEENSTVLWKLENVQDTGTNSLSETVTAGYRYQGKKPNNYIWFNNEMWRIIGYIPVKSCTTDACTESTSTSLVKIIRNESIGGLKWHTSFANTWSSSYSLYQVLNNYYLTKGNATGNNICTGTAAADCDYRVKGIGTDTYYGSMIQNVYWNTGKGLNSDTGAGIYAKEIGTQNVSGKIGLMSASDYGYAPTTHTSALSSYRTYAGTNWLYGQGNEWTLTSDSSNSTIVLLYYSTGNVGGTTASYANAVRPVLYLKDSVYVVSGDGTESRPYQIAIGS